MQTELQGNLPGATVWHRMDARWKLMALVLCSFSTALLPSVSSVGVAAACTLLLLSTAGLSRNMLLTRIGAMLPFLALALLLLPWTVPGESWLIAGFSLSKRGLHLALAICGKTLAIISLALLLLSTSREESLAVAAHRLGMPSLLVRLLLITHRYLYLLHEELGKLRIALRLRGFRNRLSRRGYRTIGHVTGTLLVRSHERGERVAQAMRCRGLDGRFRTLATFAGTRTDLGLFLVLVLGIVVLPWGMQLLWGQIIW